MGCWLRDGHPFSGERVRWADERTWQVWGGLVERGGSDMVGGRFKVGNGLWAVDDGVGWLAYLVARSVEWIFESWNRVGRSSLIGPTPILCKFSERELNEIF
jgi:hypothetical protein